MAIGRGIGIGFKSGFNWRSYWTTRTNFWVQGRNGLYLSDVYGNHPFILPVISSLDGTSNKLLIPHVFNHRDSWDITITAFWDTANNRGGLGTNNTSIFTLGRYDSDTTLFYCHLIDASSNEIIANAADRRITITNNVRTVIRVVKDNIAKTVTFYKDGTFVKTVNWNASFLNNGSDASSYYIGGNATGFLKSRIECVNINGTSIWYPTGLGLYEYDIMGTNVGTWQGNTPRFTYISNASDHYLQSGFKIYSKVGQLDEYVPTGGSTTALLTAGYTLSATMPGSTSFYNFAPSLVDFSTTSLPTFDKSNGTVHIATAGMNYYDAANPYRWRQDELQDPVIYSDTYKNVGYKGLMMIKGDVVSGAVVNCQEILSTITDQRGINEWKMAKYCTLQDLLVLTGGIPVFDGDNYLTWI